jgi:hypothetical protein
MKKIFFLVLGLLIACNTGSLKDKKDILNTTSSDKSQISIDDIINNFKDEEKGASGLVELFFQKFNIKHILKKMN